MAPRPGSRPGFFVLAGCLLLQAVVVTAAVRPRTPAEVEIRRAEIAQRLLDLAAEDARLVAQVRGLAARLARVGDAVTRGALEFELARVERRRREVAERRVALATEAASFATLVTRNATGPLTTADPAGLAVLQPQSSTGQAGSATAFNPAIAVIPDGLYANDNRQGTVREILRSADGFGDGAAAHTGRTPRGFSLREVEVAFSGAVDPYFDVWATFGIADGEIEAEEVYVQTRGLLPGLQIRAGQFYSGVGYLNRQHTHQWDFVDQALAYEAIFGSRIEEAGVQITWLPALPVYLQLGFEALQGDNSVLSNQLAGQYPGRLEETPGPRLFTGFAKLSPDLGFSHTLQLGVSGGRGRRHQEAAASPAGLGADLFEGSTWFAATEGIWRYDSARPYGQGDLTVVGEYLYRVKALDQIASVVVADARVSRQDGLLVQAVYGVGPRWTVGGRLEAIGLRNRVETVRRRLDPRASSRYSADLTFNPTEFSRLRVQYNHGRVWDERLVPFHQVFVQFQMSLGVHGAHRF